MKLRMRVSEKIKFHFLKNFLPLNSIIWSNCNLVTESAVNKKTISDLGTINELHSSPYQTWDEFLSENILVKLTKEINLSKSKSKNSEAVLKSSFSDLTRFINNRVTKYIDSDEKIAIFQNDFVENDDDDFVLPSLSKVSSKRIKVQKVSSTPKTPRQMSKSKIIKEFESIFDKNNDQKFSFKEFKESNKNRIKNATLSFLSKGPDITDLTVNQQG